MLNKEQVKNNRKIFSESDKNMAYAFKVLGDLNRYRIFRVLAEQPKISVSDLALILDISLPLASQHLKTLTNANLLQKERIGKKIFPKLEEDNLFVQAIVKTVEKVVKITGHTKQK